MTSKLQNSNHITNTCDTDFMIEFTCKNIQNWHHGKFMDPLLNFRTCKLKNKQIVFSLPYLLPKNTLYRTSHLIYCHRKLILDKWGLYDENFDLVCSSFLTPKQRLPIWFSCKDESVADHMTWLIYHQPMKISHTKLFSYFAVFFFVRIELIATLHYWVYGHNPLRFFCPPRTKPPADITPKTDMLDSVVLKGIVLSLQSS